MATTLAPRAYLRRYLLLPIFLLALGLLSDSFSTYLALASGNAIEANPLLSVLFSIPYGFWIFLVLKCFALFLAAYIAHLMRSYALWRQLLYAFLLTLCALAFLYTSLSNLSLAFFGHGFFTFLF